MASRIRRTKLVVRAIRSLSGKSATLATRTARPKYSAEVSRTSQTRKGQENLPRVRRLPRVRMVNGIESQITRYRPIWE